MEAVAACSDAAIVFISWSTSRRWSAIPSSETKCGHVGIESGGTEIGGFEWVR
jgi:hypothetical protein